MRQLFEAFQHRIAKEDGLVDKSSRKMYLFISNLKTCLKRKKCIKDTALLSPFQVQPRCMQYSLQIKILTTRPLQLILQQITENNLIFMLIIHDLWTYHSELAMGLYPRLASLVLTTITRVNSKARAKETINTIPKETRES